ncbi:MAG: hypothetical protein H6882_03050 [Rhodobiaceae bacterium]|nr:hypothetical protein [Rhodobiaceae bacterium]
MKYFQALITTGLFVAVLLAVYTLHALYFPVQVVLYSALLDGGLAALLTGAVLFALRARLAFNGFERILLIALWLLGGYAYAITLPTVLDRSLSFYILEKLQQRGGGIREDAIGDVFVSEYMPEFRLVDVRLTEQQASGTIVIENGCVKLTPRGERLANFSRFFRTHLLPKHRLLAGEYTDDLVDPFKDSAKSAMGYECE